MSYLVLARKCRPTRFTEVVGQSHVTQTLANAIKMDRVAHGFLFSGMRGVGKTSLARILAKSLNCKEGPTDNPCGVCESCKTITEGTAVDVIEIDGASNNSVEDIRDLRETVPYRPIIGRYKIYVIDEVHMLSVNAFNALLKTLEEPPPHVKFIFATTEPHKIPGTILSRIQRYDFRRISTSAIVGRIQEILEEEKIDAEDSALAIVGREADGSMRDALSILDQVLAAGEKHITAQYVASLLGVVGRQTYFELSQAIIENNPGRCLEIVQEIDVQGFDIPTFTKGLLEHLRNLVVAAVCGTDATFLQLPQEELTHLQSQAAMTTKDSLHRIFKHLCQAYEEIARSAFPKILLEAVLARVADLGPLVPATELLKRLEALSANRPQPPRAPSVNAASSSQNMRAPLVPEKKNTNSASVATASNIPADKPSGTNGRSSTHPPYRTVDDAQKVAPQPPSNSTGAPQKKGENQNQPPTVANNAPAGPLSKQRWEQLLGKLATKMPAKSSMLERANFSSQSTEAQIVLQFDKSDSFTAGQVNAGTFVKDLENFFGECLSTAIRLKIEICDLGEKSTMAQKKLESQEQRRKLEETARNHPIIRGFESALGGKISTVRLKR